MSMSSPCNCRWQRSRPRPRRGERPAQGIGLGRSRGLRSVARSVGLDHGAPVGPVAAAMHVPFGIGRGAWPAGQHVIGKRCGARRGDAVAHRACRALRRVRDRVLTRWRTASCCAAVAEHPLEHATDRTAATDRARQQVDIEVGVGVVIELAHLAILCVARQRSRCRTGPRRRTVGPRCAHRARADRAEGFGQVGDLLTTRRESKRHHRGFGACGARRIDESRAPLVAAAHRGTRVRDALRRPSQRAATDERRSCRITDSSRLPAPINAACTVMPHNCAFGLAAASTKTVAPSVQVASPAPAGAMSTKRPAIADASSRNRTSASAGADSTAWNLIRPDARCGPTVRFDS